MTATRKSFVYGDDRIEYEVAFVPVKKSKVSIHVYADCSVRVDAPEGRALPEIHRAVLKRAGWIKRHVDEFRRQRVGAAAHIHKRRQRFLSWTPLSARDKSRAGWKQL